jgi:NAD(P)-dependent dehydrogenase (short-subunit alcohol dehydrogenase family)
MFKLTDKIALGTGAGSGIGAAIAETFAQAKAHVFVTRLGRKRGLGGGQKNHFGGREGRLGDALGHGRSGARKSWCLH